MYMRRYSVFRIARETPFQEAAVTRGDLFSGA
jgi:hypothetical protein